MRATTIILLLGVHLSGCRQQPYPERPPRQTSAVVSYAPAVDEAWEKTRIVPPTLKGRPELINEELYPSGHLPAPRGARLRLVLAVSQKGNVDSVIPEEWAGVTSERLRQDIISHLRQWTFHPARDENGHPIASDFPLTVQF